MATSKATLENNEADRKFWQKICKNFLKGQASFLVWLTNLNSHVAIKILYYPLGFIIRSPCTHSIIVFCNVWYFFSWLNIMYNICCNVINKNQIKLSNTAQQQLLFGLHLEIVSRSLPNRIFVQSQFYR